MCRLLVQALLSKDFLTRLDKEAFSKQLRQREALASLLAEVGQGREEAKETLSQLIKVVHIMADNLPSGLACPMPSLNVEA